MNSADIADKLRQAQNLISQCLSALECHHTGEEKRARPEPLASASSMDYSMSSRAFMKKYSKGLSGAKKFVLLVAYMAKGRPEDEVEASKVREQWDKMESLVKCKYNVAFSTIAREQDWVVTTKHGVYKLRPSWQDIFKEL